MTIRGKLDDLVIDPHSIIYTVGINTPSLPSINLVDKSYWGLIKEKHALKPFFDRCLIIIDEERTRLDCTVCSGKGHLGVICQYCLGTKFKNSKEKSGPCPDCLVKGDGSKNNPLERCLGKALCVVCSGKGTNSLIIPDSSKKRPLTGDIIAIGPNVVQAKVGMKVLFTNFAGTDFELDGVMCKWINEKDITAQYKKLKEDGAEIEANTIVNDEPEKLGIGENVIPERTFK